MRLFKPFMAIALVLLTTPVTAEAKDLSGRLGIGYTNDFSNSTSDRNVPALSLKYAATKDLHVLGALGFNTLSPTSFTLGGKIFKNIFYETNLNFYTSVGLAYLKANQSGVDAFIVKGEPVENIVQTILKKKE